MENTEGVFEIYPAIDLLAGQSVRLQKGARESAEVVHGDPIAQMQSFQRSGAHWVHIVDLGAAFGDSSNSIASLATQSVIKNLVAKTSLKIQVGGGVRNESQAESLFDLGVHRVVVGTWAVKDPDAVCRLAQRFPGRIVAGLDTVDGFVSVQGWTEKSVYTPAEFGSKLFQNGLTLGLFTEVERDGLLTGIDWRKAEALAKETRLAILASGGVRDIEDIKGLAQCQGVCGVVVGKALAAGTLKLEDAIRYQRES